MHVQDPPNKTRPRHHHHADVLYVYTQGEHHIEGEGTYRAGDLRWTRAGHVYGPETTGPDGGGWWIVSYGDPIPVSAKSDSVDAAPPLTNEKSTSDALMRFEAPIDWDAVHAYIERDGGVIVSGVLPSDLVDRLANELNDYLVPRPQAGMPRSGSNGYDLFLGKNTIRLHGLVTKLKSAGELIAFPDIVAAAKRSISPLASSILLNAGEVIQIGLDEPAQFLHRDTDSWPTLTLGGAPALINAIVALDPFTEENGATYIAPGSHKWELGRSPLSSELVRAVMKRGDILLFRGDLLHGGGENKTTMPRRAISVSYCAGWLRPVENSFLNVPADVARQLPKQLQEILGYVAHDASGQRGGMVGLYEGGSPEIFLKRN